MQAETPFMIGEKYLICTVTRYYTGKVINTFQKFVQLENAAWIPATGRWMQANSEGLFKEVEPYKNNPWINSDAVVDLVRVDWELPTTQK